MCGIYGRVNYTAPVDIGQVKRSTDLLENRGPDASGVTRLDDGMVALGHRRLSIIDLSEDGHQPMTNEDGTVWLTFNGEIYNYQDLRSELLQYGHQFKSSTDSEVLVHAYEQWGHDCVNRLRGIFAFGIWDQPRRSLFLARDHLGVKPLYFHVDNSHLQFASLPRSILDSADVGRAIDRTALRDYFAYGYVPEPYCIFEGIEKVPPGHTLRAKDGDFALHRYWRPEYRPVITSFEEATEAVSAKVRECAKLQMTSDVPVATLLSGGIDSTYLTSLAVQNQDLGHGQFRTFTLGFDEPTSDERRFAKVAAEYYETNHVTAELTQSHFPAQLDVCAAAYDEPFDLNGGMPATYISKLVRDNGTKVVLGGDGGDELFAGYLRYDQFSEYRQKTGRRSANWLMPWLGRSRHAADVEEYFKHEGVCGPELLETILPSFSTSGYAHQALDTLDRVFDSTLPPVTACQIADLQHYLPGHILTKVDRASMHYGVEARVPFLDHTLVELAMKLDCSVNYRIGERKAVLKAAAANQLPPSLLNGRKKGFSCPIGPWATPEFLDWANARIDSGVLVESQLVSRGASTACSSSGDAKAFRAFWLILAAELWASRWLSPEGVPVTSNTKPQLVG